MKKEQFAALKPVAPKDYSNILTSSEPLNAGRLPVGKQFTFHPTPVIVPGLNGGKDWQAIVAQVGDDYYTMSPRTALGLGFRDSKLVQVIDTKLSGKKALIDFLKTNPKGKVTEYAEAEVDVFGKDGEKAPKSYPIFDMKGE